MQKRRFIVSAALVCALAATTTVPAATFVFSATGLVRANGGAVRDFTVVQGFDSAVSSSLAAGHLVVQTSLADLLSGEGLLGGPAAGTFFQGDIATLPSGISFSAASGDPSLNSGLAGSTALFADLQGSVAGTANLYYLGDPVAGATDPNRVQFSATDVGTNADNMMVLRPVSFDSNGEAIEVRSNEKGVLEAGRFTMNLDASLGIRGVKITFIDTEGAASATTGISNIYLDGNLMAETYNIPAGGNDNEYFVGFLGSRPITSFDVDLGSINGSQTGGDGVLLDAAMIEFITIPEPGTLVLLSGGLALCGRRRRR